VRISCSARVASQPALLLLGLLLGAHGWSAENCRFEVAEPELKESAMIVIGRGFNTGFSGHLGRRGDRYYLRGRYFSSFAATPSFDERTPLAFGFADGTLITLPLQEAATGRLDWHPMLANNRDTQPIFAVSAEHLARLAEGDLTEVHVRRLDKGTVGSKHYKVRQRFAKQIAAAARCLSLSRDP